LRIRRYHISPHYRRLPRIDFLPLEIEAAVENPWLREVTAGNPAEKCSPIDAKLAG
jgi:hypothetical protein